ncbi:hypothetical protein F3Y22_tig00002237pilonHSYRG00228 [Hibiscus syriacus]|uniref:Transposase MuDR plant domain-containing protein n=1 Tax=Hibiscus syriacus TaxID=106335 RepID=A0A6A3CXL2_HIBSY|nr:hypothetical protein F3Y22_tig00002237pilonHSYRG00228 [Hibiscus syriacus]
MLKVVCKMDSAESDGLEMDNADMGSVERDNAEMGSVERDNVEMGSVERTILKVWVEMDNAEMSNVDRDNEKDKSSNEGVIGTEADFEEVVVEDENNGSNESDSDFQETDGENSFDDEESLPSMVEDDKYLGDMGRHEFNNRSDEMFDSSPVNSGELNSDIYSDSDARPTFPEFNKDIDMENPKFQKGMLFCSKETLKEAIRQYGRVNRITILFKVNDNKRLQAICREGCPWKLWASPLHSHDSDSNSWQITTYESEHTCAKLLKIRMPVIAVGTDANGGIYPIAYAVVETVAELFLNAEARNCVRHIYANFKKDHKGKALKDALWRATRATYGREFQDAITELKTLSNDAFEWLKHLNPQQWSKAQFSTTTKSDMLLNNLCECFNKVLSNRLLSLNRPYFASIIEKTTWKANQKRRKEADEGNKNGPKLSKKGSMGNSSKCGKPGHNKRTCRGEVGGNRSLNQHESGSRQPHAPDQPSQHSTPMQRQARIVQPTRQQELRPKLPTMRPLNPSTIVSWMMPPSTTDHAMLGSQNLLSLTLTIKICTQYQKNEIGSVNGTFCVVYLGT